MPFSETQKKDVLEVLDALYSYSVGRRVLSTLFRELPDKNEWKEYYAVIPQPRCLDGVKASIEKNRLPSVDAVKADIGLIFRNAMHFNQDGSIIWEDARTLLEVFEKTWATKASLRKNTLIIKRTPKVVPAPPPPSAPTPASPPGEAPSTSKLVEVNKAMSVTPAPEPTIQEPPLLSQEELADLPIERLIQLTESRMKIWNGPSSEGWMPAPRDPHARYSEIISILKNFRVASTGDRPAVALERIPEGTDVPFLYHQDPVSFSLIEQRATKYYTGHQSFDMDLFRLFEKGRRLYRDSNKDDYGRVILLQRMWQHLTSASSSVPAMTRAGYNFASISAGPGNERALAAASATIDSRDRDFLDQISYKGSSYHIGDYVHLANPDDTSKPIVGQIYKLFVPRGKPEQHCIAVNWYYLPEQTIHNRQHLFFENEAIKTGQSAAQSCMPLLTCPELTSILGLYVDHTIEDVIEKISVQSFSKHLRGRPLGPAWYPGWPLYVCDQRYNPADRTFVRITNWLACIPEEVRSPNFMPVLQFDPEGQRFAHQRRLKSPFLRGTKGPGYIGEEGIVNAESSSDHPTTVPNATSTINFTSSTPGTGTSNAAQVVQATTISEPHGARKAEQELPRVKRHYTKRGTGETAMRKAREAAEAKAVAEAAAAARPPAIPFQPVRALYQPPPRVQHHKRKIDDRSVSAAAGGPAYLRDAKIEVLPNETVEKFDRDPKTGKLLWFSGPPIRPTPPSAYHPRHSLAYLAFLARKRTEETTTKEGLDDLDGNTKRRRVGSEEMEIDSSGGTVERLPLPSVRQLLDQWHVEPDGSLVQHTAPSALEDETLAVPSELLATSINNLALSLSGTEDTRE